MKLEFIKEEMTWVDRWTLGLVDSIDDEHWGIVPGLETSINWLVGHMIISKYYHAIECVVKETDEISKNLFQEITIEDFRNYYSNGSDPLVDWKERPGKGELIKCFQRLNEVTNQILNDFNENELDHLTAVESPVARSIYEALTFSFKHQMWHYGQIAMAKRIIGNR